MSIRTIAITGADGFIGRRVVEACLAAGKQVRALVGPPEERKGHLPADVESVSADINNVGALSEVFVDAGMVVHLAGPASVADSFKRPADYLRIHAQGTASVIQSVHHMGIRRFVYISSAEVYGRPQACPVREDHRLEARSPYAAAKIAAEKVVEALCRAHQINTYILRPFSVYGPGQSRHSLLATILRQIANLDNDVIRLQNLSPVRDYCYVDDLAHAIVLAAGRDTTGLTVCNIGTSIGTSVSELARAVLKIVGRNLDVVEVVDRQRPPNSEIYSLIANRRAAADSLGWSPRIALPEGLVKTIRQMELQP